MYVQTAWIVTTIYIQQLHYSNKDYYNEDTPNNLSTENYNV